MNNSVTVFVAVKNKADVIDKCLDSLLCADWPYKEILVVDNMSIDGSYEKLLKYKNKINLHRMEGGVSKLFNLALENSKNEYFICTDADCVVDKNWIKTLIAPFSYDQDIIATAGFCGTPRSANLLQKLIGLELENRYHKFKRYIERAPTMNLCLKSEIAKKVKFDEDFIYQAFEVDFCYRLTKHGRILYVPEAIILHYHRSNIFSYIKQQKDQAKWGWKLFIKHGRKAMADQITNFSMSLQILLFGLGFLCFLFSFLTGYFNFLSLLVLTFLIVIYIKNILEIKPPIFYFPLFLALFFIRTFSWAVGSIEGVFHFSIRGKLT